MAGGGQHVARAVSDHDRSTRIDLFHPDDVIDQEALVVEGALEIRPVDALEQVGETDVLVLPSVMRESYSLLTREALARGVPVLTSDSVGPEEVVRDGVNGLVVPSGDATVLAAAMRRLCLRRGC